MYKISFRCVRKKHKHFGGQVFGKPSLIPDASTTICTRPNSRASPLCPNLDGNLCPTLTAHWEPIHFSELAETGSRQIIHISIRVLGWVLYYIIFKKRILVGNISILCYTICKQHTNGISSPWHMLFKNPTTCSCVFCSTPWPMSSPDTRTRNQTCNPGYLERNMVLPSPTSRFRTPSFAQLQIIANASTFNSKTVPWITNLCSAAHFAHNGFFVWE